MKISIITFIFFNFRLFYAGACEGQMPEILTMIQMQRFTPTPAVLIMALLSMLYLTVSDIFALINYVGFATWVNIKFVHINGNFISMYIIKFFFSVEYRSLCGVPALASLETTKSWTSHPSESHLPTYLYFSYHFRNCCADDCQSSRNWIWMSYDIVIHSCVFSFYIVEEQTQLVPEWHR